MFVELTGQGREICEALGRAFFDAGETLYLVGGAVRDLVLGRGAGADYDFTTSAAAARIPGIVRPLARFAYDKSPAKGYGTHGVILKNKVEVEITPYRDWAAVAMQQNGRRGDSPVPGPADSLDTDLFGRDFTINAMAVDISPAGFGTLVDPCGGESDLAARVLRTPVAPGRTFADDPLRPMRAVRFAAALDFTIEDRAFACIRALAAAEPSPLLRPAPERIREELFHMLELPRPSRAMLLLREAGILRLVLPEVEALAGMQPEPGAHHKDNFAHTLAVLDEIAACDAGRDDVVLRFAALVHDIGKPAARRLDDHANYSFTDHDKIGAELADKLCVRLRFSNAHRARTVRLVRLHNRLHPFGEAWTDAAVRRAVNELGEDLDAMLAFSRADITSSDMDKMAARRAALDVFAERVQGLDRAVLLDPQPPIQGQEIMALLGLQKGGPQVGRAVKYLKQQIVDGALDPQDADAARRIVQTREWDQA
jgi:poly(A) polymerase